MFAGSACGECEIGVRTKCCVDTGTGAATGRERLLLALEAPPAAAIPKNDSRAVGSPDMCQAGDSMTSRVQYAVLGKG